MKLPSACRRPIFLYTSGIQGRQNSLAEEKIQCRSRPDRSVLSALRSRTHRSIDSHDTTSRLLPELSPKVGDGGNRKGGISWGCLTPPLLHRRSDMPCPMITSQTEFSQETRPTNSP